MFVRCFSVSISKARLSRMFTSDTDDISIFNNILNSHITSFSRNAFLKIQSITISYKKHIAFIFIFWFILGHDVLPQCLFPYYSLCETTSLIFNFSTHKRLKSSLIPFSVRRI